MIMDATITGGGARSYMIIDALNIVSATYRDTPSGRLYNGGGFAG